MRHCELKDPEPNADPKCLGNVGSGSAYNEYGSATLPACYHEYSHKTIIPCPSQYALMNFNISQSFPTNPSMLS